MPGCSSRPSCAVNRRGIESSSEGGTQTALARVVTFDGVTKERMAELEREMSTEPSARGSPVTEMIVLHDAGAEKSVVVVFFDNEADDEKGDAALSAMPAGDTQGSRTSVEK